LTYPITLAPAAQMMEHHLVTAYDHFQILCRSSIPRSGGTSSSFAGYSAIAEATPPESAVQTSPDHSHPADREVDLRSTSVGAKLEPSVCTRCANRLVMVIMTTIVAAYIPCFGTVSFYFLSSTIFSFFFTLF
jgi:hypothetical protein